MNGFFLRLKDSPEVLVRHFRGWKSVRLTSPGRFCSSLFTPLTAFTDVTDDDTRNKRQCVITTPNQLTRPTPQNRKPRRSRYTNCGLNHSQKQTKRNRLLKQKHSILSILELSNCFYYCLNITHNKQLITSVAYENRKPSNREELSCYIGYFKEM